MFDRFDICEAWYLYLGQWYSGQNDPKYARLSRLMQFFKPRPNLSFETLTENGRRIYLDLIAEEDSVQRLLELPRVDDFGDQWMLCTHCGGNEVLIRCSSWESADEALIEWFDHPDRIGAFVGVTEGDILEWAPDDARDEIEEALDAGDWDNETLNYAREVAESDLNMVGHTTLKHWDYDQGMPGLPHTDYTISPCDPDICALLSEEEDAEDDDEL